MNAHPLRAFAPSREPLAPSPLVVRLISLARRREDAKKEEQSRRCRFSINFLRFPPFFERGIACLGRI
jgi:hypothetical protein